MSIGCAAFGFLSSDPVKLTCRIFVWQHYDVVGSPHAVWVQGSVPVLLQIQLWERSHGKWELRLLFAPLVQILNFKEVWRNSFVCAVSFFVMIDCMKKSLIFRKQCTIRNWDLKVFRWQVLHNFVERCFVRPLCDAFNRGERIFLRCAREITIDPGLVGRPAAIWDFMSLNKMKCSYVHFLCSRKCS